MYKFTQMLAIDIETSKAPAMYPWREGFYVSLISCCEPSGHKTTFLFYHDDYDSVQQTVLGPPAKQLMDLQKLINKYSVIVGQNLKFDVNNLKMAGIDFEGKQFFCTLVAAYMLDCHTKAVRKLDILAAREGLQIKDDAVKDMWDAGINTAQIPLSILQPYCEHDAWLASQLAKRYLVKLKSKRMLKCFKLSMEFMDMLSDMEIAGIVFDAKKAEKLITRYKKLANILEGKAKKILIKYINSAAVDEFNLSSGDELSAALYGGEIKRRVKGPKIIEKNVKVRMPYVFTYKTGKSVIKNKIREHPGIKCLRYTYKDRYYVCKGMGIRPAPRTKLQKTTSSGAEYYKVDKDTLNYLTTTTREQKVLIKLLLRVSVINKMLETFKGKTKNSGLLNKIGIDGLLHTNYNQAITATGRLSSNDPNSQNFPRGGTSPVKTCIVPRFDFILDADLSSIELRVPAQMSQDIVMIRELNSGEDLHKNTGRDIFNNEGTRIDWKIFNFRMIYGGTEYGYFKDPKMPSFSLKRWGTIIKAYYKKYNGLKGWHEALVKAVISAGGYFTLPTGRTYKFLLNTQPGYNSGKFNERQIKNYPVQGMAGADILPLAAVIIYRGIKRLGLKSIPILTVHDSIVFDVVKGEVDVLADLCIRVFEDLPKYIKQYWGINWIVNLTGEVELGRTYGETKRIR